MSAAAFFGGLVLALLGVVVGNRPRVFLAAALLAAGLVLMQQGLEMPS